MGLRPSVTTIIGILDKPGLRRWWNGKLIEAVWKTPARFYGELPKDYEERVLKEAQAYTDWAADYGTRFHAAVSRELSGHPELPDDDQTDVAEAFWYWYATSGLVSFASEHSFVTDLGFAGTVDFEGTLHGEPCIVDFKTQDIETLEDAHFYEENILQLSGYALGTGLTTHLRINVVISRLVPGCIVMKVWRPTKSDPDLPARWLHAFELLWEFWKTVKNYDPTIEGEQAWQSRGALPQPL